jgi:hypothetical protein
MAAAILETLRQNDVVAALSQSSASTALRPENVTSPTLRNKARLTTSGRLHLNKRSDFKRDQ